MARPRTNPVDTFWKKVEITAGCWLWPSKGYGNHWTGRKVISAHRFSYELHSREPIPEGMNVLHHCDVKRCVNPEHLYLGTTKDNARDREERRRQEHLHGERHPHAKLTGEQVNEIRRRYDAGDVTQKQLAEEYGVGRPHISRLVNAVQWGKQPGRSRQFGRGRKLASTPLDNAAKLTPEQVLEIRRRYKPREVSLSMLAREYGVSIKTVHLVVQGKTWTHLSPPDFFASTSALRANP